MSLSNVDNVKDLGVHVDNQVSFDYHCNEIVKKANRMLATIRRTFVHIDACNMVPLFKSLVRPYLEYGVEVWSPRTKKNIRLLESVQRRATKLVPELAHLPYPERLKSLKLPSLVYRRHRGDMIQVYKYLNDVWEVDDDFLKLSSEERTRGHKHKLYKGRWDSAIRGHFLSNRTVNLWNSLSEKVINSKDVTSFKVALDHEWQSKSWLYDFESDT